MCQDPGVHVVAEGSGALLDLPAVRHLDALSEDHVVVLAPEVLLLVQRAQREVVPGGSAKQ